MDQEMDLMQLQCTIEDMHRRLLKLEEKNSAMVEVPFYTDGDVREAVASVEQSEIEPRAMPEGLFEIRVMLEIGGFPDPSDLRELIEKYRSKA